MLLCYVIDSGLSTSLLLLATLIIMFYIFTSQEASKNRNVSMYSKYIGLNQNDVGKKSVETAVD